MQFNPQGFVARLKRLLDPHYSGTGPVVVDRSTLEGVVECIEAQQEKLKHVLQTDADMCMENEALHNELDEVKRQNITLQAQLDASRNIRKYASFVLTGDENTNLESAVDAVQWLFDEYSKVIEEQYQQIKKLQEQREEDKRQIIDSCVACLNTGKVPAGATTLYDAVKAVCDHIPRT